MVLLLSWGVWPAPLLCGQVLDRHIVVAHVRPFGRRPAIRLVLFGIDGSSSQYLERFVRKFQCEPEHQHSGTSIQHNDACGSGIASHLRKRCRLTSLSQVYCCPSGRGAGGAVVARIAPPLRALRPLPPTPSLKGRGRIFLGCSAILMTMGSSPAMTT